MGFRPGQETDQLDRENVAISCEVAINRYAPKTILPNQESSVYLGSSLSANWISRGATRFSVLPGQSNRGCMFSDCVLPFTWAVLSWKAPPPRCETNIALVCSRSIHTHQHLHDLDLCPATQASMNGKINV